MAQNFHEHNYNTQKTRYVVKATMQFIDILHGISAVAFLISALHKLAGTQQEHFYTRVIAAAWFAFTVFEPEMNILLVRVISNCVIIAIPMTEIASPILTKYWRRK